MGRKEIHQQALCRPGFAGRGCIPLGRAGQSLHPPEAQLLLLEGIMWPGDSCPFRVISSALSKKFHLVSALAMQ